MSEFQSAGKAGDIGQGTMTSVELAGREVAVVNVDGAYFAFENRCNCITHFAGHVEAESSDGHRHVGDSGRLTEGALDGERVTCPMHFSVFDVRNGRPLKGPGEIPLNTYEVRLDQGNLLVALMSDAERHFWNDPGNKERP